MLKLSDLARRPDLRLGPLLVSPSRRLIQGPGGEAHLEPLTMQVLLLLLDSGGKVVTRAELFEQCWGGGIAGDDSLNQAVAKLRRTAAQVAPGLFEIETIPRTGYRLTGELAASLADQPDSAGRSGLPRRMSRRALVVSAAAGAGIVAGGLGLGALLSKDGGEFDALMKRGEEELDFGDPARPAAPYFEQAAALREDSAKAQGLLAYSHALAAEYGSPGAAGVGVLAAERAARTALTLDPAQPDALLANVLLQRSTMDLATTEDRLRAILRDDPRNIRVMRQLWHVLHNAGRCRDSLAAVERALAVRPLAAANNFPRAQLLWVLGRNAEADRVIDRAMQYWPTHRWVRFARFMIFAFTDRPRAALAMIDDPATRPQHYTPEAVALWRVSLAALDQREPAAVAAARDANLAAAERNLSLAPQAILTLSGLGELDSAFEVANGLLVFGRPVTRRTGTGSVGPPITSMSWRFAPWMFTPATAPMRADPRFQSLCEGIGLTDYWNKRGIKPDYQLGIV